MPDRRGWLATGEATMLIYSVKRIGLALVIVLVVMTRLDRAVGLAPSVRDDALPSDNHALGCGATVSARSALRLRGR